VRPVPVEPQNPSIVHSDDKLVRVHHRQPMRMLEAKSRWRVHLACLSQNATIRGGPPLEVIWPESDCVELVRLVDDVDVEGIVVGGIGQTDTLCSDWGGEMQVEDQRGIAVLLLL